MMIKKIAQVLLMFIIGINACYGMEHDSPEEKKGLFNKGKDKVKKFFTHEKKGRNLQLDAIKYEEDTLLPNNYTTIKRNLSCEYFFLEEIIEKNPLPKDIKDILTTFLYEIALRDMVYQFPGINTLKEIIRSIPESQKQYPPHQAFKIAYDYTNIYIINGTEVIYDGFCSFPFFSNGCKEVRSPFYYAFFWNESQEFTPIEKSDTTNAPLKKYSYPEAHGLYINGFLDLFGRPLDLSQYSITLMGDEKAKCISGYCKLPCSNPYHFLADHVCFRIVQKEG